MGSSLPATLGEWRAYGGTFEITEKMEVLFDTMGENEKRWMEDYSVIVDCMYLALSNGGIVKRDVTVVV